MRVGGPPGTVCRGVRHMEPTTARRHPVRCCRGVDRSIDRSMPVRSEDVFVCRLPVNLQGHPVEGSQRDQKLYQRALAANEPGKCHCVLSYALFWQRPFSQNGYGHPSHTSCTSVACRAVSGCPTKPTIVPWSWGSCLQPSRLSPASLLESFLGSLPQPVRLQGRGSQRDFALWCDESFL